MSTNDNLIERGCSEDWQVVREAAGDVTTDEFSELCIELVALRKQAILDRQSREASQVEFARLNRELNEAKERIQVLLDEIGETAIASGMMDPGQRGDIDGVNAIHFLRLMKEQHERK